MPEYLSEEPLHPTDRLPPDSLVRGQKRISTPVLPGNTAGSTHPARAAIIWGAVAVSLVILVLLIIFFIQNQDMIAVKFISWEGSLAQGVAFFTAAVGGGILVAIAGGARILQLRRNERRQRKNTGRSPSGPR